MRAEVTSEVAKAAPPVGMTAIATVQGWGWAEVIQGLTIIYLVGQIGYLLWRWYHEYQAKRKP